MARDCTVTLALLLSTSCCFVSAADRPSVHVSSATVSRTNERYASYNVDGSWNRGFFNIDWTNANLRAAAASLAPSTLRFGGGGNDYIIYNEPDGRCSAAGNSDRGPPLPPGYNCLNASHFAAFHGMAVFAEAEMIFGASFDKVSACAAGSATKLSTFVWNATNVAAWIRHMQAAELAVWAFELGNEVNNQGVGPDGQPDRHNCSLTPLQQAAAIMQLASVLEELYPNATSRPKLIGPDTGFKDPQSWLNETLRRVGHMLHAVTHHVYLGAERKNFNSVKMLNRGLDDIGWYVPLVKQHAPAAEIWAGEDGPTGGGDSGDCGSPGTAICGLYGSALWYADDMGQRAAHGFHQYQRQDLVGAAYSLVTIPHDNEYLGSRDAVGLTADFWVNFLWKRTVGTHVLSADVVGSEAVRAYVHCGAAPSPHRIQDIGATAVLINLDNSSSVSVTVTGASRLLAWTLSPTPGGGPFGRKVMLNGELLPDKITDAVAFTSIPVPPRTLDGSEVTLPPISVSFVAIEGLSPTGC